MIFLQPQDECIIYTDKEQYLSKDKKWIKVTNPYLKLIKGKFLIRTGRKFAYVKTQ